MKKFGVLPAACVASALTMASIPAAAQYAGPDYYEGPFNYAAGCLGGCSAEPVIGDLGRPELRELHDGQIVMRLSRGFRLLDAERYDRASRTFKTALRRYPHNPVLKFHAGRAAYLNGETDTARELFTKAMASDDKDGRDEDSMLNEAQRTFAMNALANLEQD
ncbi:MAG: tetratricopeptide repeat protein [Erythrobacter sp.]